MFRKNSFFIKVFIPAIAVMLLQLSIIGLVLSTTGTISSLEDAAIETLRKNTDNRGATLEQNMIFYWSNLDRLELEVIDGIEEYLDESEISIEEALGNYFHEIAILDRLSQPLIDALRASMATGIYVILLDKDGFEETAQTRNGLYYRDFNPLSNPTDNSDLIYLKGYIDIARKDRIQLDSLWSEDFTFDPQYEDLWRGFANPQKAAMQYPDTSTVNLAYWNGPHLQNPHSIIDANKCITYTRPVFYHGRPVALIGTEVQIVQLEKYFPSGDFESDSQGGYMLLSYDTGQEGILGGNVFHVTGSYVRRLIAPGREISLTPARRGEDIYTIESETINEGVEVAMRPIRLYNANAPFSNEQWALAAIGTDEMLFSAPRNLSLGILLNSALAFIVGVILLLVTIRRATRPLISIADQIEKSGHDGTGHQVFTDDSNTYEINLLCSTLNTMNERRNFAESLVREERQRYLIALESATDTFMEYDIKQDTFMLYYFADENSTRSGADTVGGNGRELSHKTISSFKQIVADGQFCHANDIHLLEDLVNQKGDKTIEIRAKTSVFSHITAVEPDGDYYWFAINATYISDEEGRISKIIGTAKEITQEKLEEFFHNEAVRRDSTTGFYNKSYGLQSVKLRISDTGHDIPYVLCYVCIEDFNKLESFYGRIFGAFVLMEFGHSILSAIGEHDIAVRLSNDEFLFYFHQAHPDDAMTKINLIKDISDSIYAGENTSIQFTVRADIISSAEESEIANSTDNPISISLDVNRSNIVSSVFDLFEFSSDIHSSINILLGVLGRMYNLDRLAICSFDAGFGTTQVTNQWKKDSLLPLPVTIEKVSHTDSAAFEDLLDENGALLYTSYDFAGFSEGILKILCAYPLRDDIIHPKSAYCCVMRDGQVHIGHILFISSDLLGFESPDVKQDLCDITKIISANIIIEKSRSASRAKSEFLSRVSHEIRTPMNAIIGMTDIAKSVINDPDRLLDSLNHIDFSAKHLLTLINDVLEMSRIESGKLRIENGPFTLDGLIKGIETMMRFPIESNNITFKINKNYSNNAVIGDEYRLRQVLLNLLGNANKFTGEGGTIVLMIEQISIIRIRDVPVLNVRNDTNTPIQHSGDDNKLFGVYKFSVMDNGIGIKPEDQQLIFEAFEQATVLTDKQHQGTGLGLAISGSIVSAMGSKIELDSTIGEGSNFHFTLHLQLSEEADKQISDSEIKPADYTGRFKGKRVLLVDDVRTNVAVATFALGEMGIEIDVAYNGQQAVDMFFESVPWYYDIILMDIKMPVMDGLTATRNIRSNTDRPDAGGIPIIAMTANAYDEDLRKSIESGMNGHITKPVIKEKLFEIMAQLIER